MLALGSTGPAVVDIQSFLRLKTDGQFGPGTAKAVKAWQADHGLDQTGEVGPAELKVFYGEPGDAPPWYIKLQERYGETEVPGSGANPFVAECHHCTDLHKAMAGSDETPWCSSVICWSLQCCGQSHTRSAAAASWLSYGRTCGPKIGAIAVIQQRIGGRDVRTGSASGYHVGLVSKLLDDRLLLLGGNQHNSVKYSLFSHAKYKFISYRWPM